MSGQKASEEGRASAVIVLGFALVIITMLGLAGSGIHYLYSANTIFSRVVEQHNVQTELMHDILGLAQERSLTLQHMMQTDDPFEQDEHIMYMSKIVQDYLVVREKLLTLPLTAREQELLDQQGELTRKTGMLQNRVVELLMDERPGEAKQLFYAEAIPGQRRAMVIMREFISLQAAHNSAEARDVTDIIKSDTRVIVTITLIGLFSSLFIAFYVYRRISSEFQRRLTIESELEERVRIRTEELNYIARHDRLTSLPNRGAFEEQLEQATQSAVRYQRCYALLFFDLDGFKAVNDSLGHGAGDFVLKEIAQRLATTVRRSDTVARIGGDEFAVLLEEVADKGDVIGVCEKLIETVNQPVLYVDQQCRVGTSIGVTFIYDDSKNADELMTEADDAMYEAKSKGKNTYSISEARPCCAIEEVAQA